MRRLSETTTIMANRLGISFPTPLPLFVSPPNKKHLSEWADSQVTPVSRRIAHKMVDNLQYIPFEAFLKQLQKTIDHFHHTINDEPYLLLVGELRADKLAEGCSDQWVVGLALEYCGLKEPEAIVTPTQLKVLQATHTRIINILMLDDAAYSGEQKSSIFDYFGMHNDAFKMKDVSFYVGIPFMTRYATNTLSSRGIQCKRLIVLEHVYMPSTADILDAEEVFYAKQADIGYISPRQTITYFDHRFADFFSCFQQIYEGSSLLSRESVCMMHFLGYTFDANRAKQNKMLQLVTNPDEYNERAITWTTPNYGCDYSGYTIPKIISPYKLRSEKDKQALASAIALGQVGDRSTYAVNDPEISAVVSKKVLPCMGLFRFKQSKMPIAEQMGYDKAVMMGNQNTISYVNQLDVFSKHQQVLHELKHFFPILKPVETHLDYPYVQVLIDVFVMLVRFLCMLFRIVSDSLSLDYDPISRMHIN